MEVYRYRYLISNESSIHTSLPSQHIVSLFISIKTVKMSHNSVELRVIVTLSRRHPRRSDKEASNTELNRRSPFVLSCCTHKTFLRQVFKAVARSPDADLGGNDFTKRACCSSTVAAYNISSVALCPRPAQLHGCRLQ